MKVFRYIFIIVVIGLIIFSAYSIYNKDQNEDIQENNQTETEHTQIITNLKMGISKYDTMNPLISTNKAVQYIDKLIFEPLVTLNEDFSIKNCLAKEYSKTGDMTYVIKLRDDVKWHDGTKITAKDVQFTIDRLKDGNISSIYQESVRNVLSVEVIDEQTVKIYLDKDVPFFEYNLIFPIMPYHYYINEDFAQSSKTPIGTGMYKITRIESTYIQLSKNEDWWNKDINAKIDNITINLYNSMGEVYNAFKIGNIDIIPTSNSNYTQYVGTIGFGVKEFKSRDYDFMAFNLENVTLQKKEVRQAIAYAIDKSNIVATIYNNNYEISNYPLDFGHYLYEDEKTYIQYNQEQAQKLLQDNGWELKYRTWSKWEDYRTYRTSFNLVVNSSNIPRVAVAESIKNQLADIGIEINIRKVSDYQYNYYLESKNYDIILTGTTESASPDMRIYFGEDNLSKFINEEALNIINDAKNIGDKKVLRENYKKLQKIYEDEAYYISLYRNKEYLIYNLNLIGELNPNWYNIYYNIENWYKQN